MELLTSMMYQMEELNHRYPQPKKTPAWKAIGQAGILVRRGEHYSGTTRRFQEEYFDDYIFDGFTPTRRP